MHACLPAGIVIGGIPITLLDTAGLRESGDLVEQIGVERSLAAARQADIVAMVVDAEAGWTPGDAEIFHQMFGGSSSSGSGSDTSSSGESSSGGENLSSSSGSGDSSSHGSGGSRRPPALLVLNKTDLAMQQQQQQQLEQQQGSSNGSGSALAAAAAVAQAATAALGGVPAEVGSQFSAVVQTSAATRAGLAELQQAVLRLAGAPQVRRGCPCGCPAVCTCCRRASAYMMR
jgi:tRNA U34 5-carboxymethylaminomethyl modifying GTPase MnmE/TrmE